MQPSLSYMRQYPLIHPAWVTRHDSSCKTVLLWSNDITKKSRIQLSKNVFEAVRYSWYSYDDKEVWNLQCDIMKGVTHSDEAAVNYHLNQQLPAQFLAVHSINFLFDFPLACSHSVVIGHSRLLFSDSKPHCKTPAQHWTADRRCEQWADQHSGANIR